MSEEQLNTDPKEELKEPLKPPPAPSKDSTLPSLMNPIAPVPQEQTTETILVGPDDTLTSIAFQRQMRHPFVFVTNIVWRCSNG